MPSLSLVLAYLFTMAAIPASLAGLASYWRKDAKAEGASQSTTPNSNSGNTKFFGSQIGGTSVINYSYTDMPWRLMAFDVYYFFKFIWALPYIIMPLTPADSGDLDELSFTRQNLFCILIHFILCILQLGFILSLPALFLLPIWTAVLLVAVFMFVNKSLCTLLNGPSSSQVEYHSDPKYAPALPEHAHEQWIFINGVAVGDHWMRNNLNRLALTFKRPILGIHNKTDGIIFDVVECLVQRNLGYATSDVRVCYRIIKDKLYDPRYSKVVFLLHSQGAIEGSLIIDWLLQELPQDLLSKLEVYTFGNAANHFNNPHRFVRTQDEAFRNPLVASTDFTPSMTITTSLHNTSPSGTSVPNSANTTIPSNNSLTLETRTPSPSAVSGRAIGHIEHYAHTTDFVALWGVMHFATSTLSTKTMPRFIGRVFARTSARGGHQMCQHYLDGMFPLARDAATGEFVGCAEENEFMESEILVGSEDDNDGGNGGEPRVEGQEVEGGVVRRERLGSMFLGWVPGIIGGQEELVNGVDGHDSDDGDRNGGVQVHGGSPVEERGRFRSRNINSGRDQVAKVKVKDLSRLWQYRNGRSPEDDKPPLLTRDADGVIRTATL